MTFSRKSTLQTLENTPMGIYLIRRIFHPKYLGGILLGGVGGGGGDLEVGIYTHKGLSAFGNMRLVLIFINI